MPKHYAPPLVFLALLCLAGCGGSEGGFQPIDPSAAVFWDRQTTESAALLREMAGEFNEGYDGLPIKVERAGGYSEIFRKVTASIQARRLPALAVSYESMTTEYVPTGAVADLDPLVGGLSPEDRADFFPVVLETNVFEEHGGKMYSFPLAKSVLMMYFNKLLLAEAGIDAPPRTWDEFLNQCRQIKEKTGNYAHAISVDCSTIDGMIYSMGGEVIRGRETLFNSPESIRVFELLETLVKEDLAYQVSPGSFDDQVALANGQVAFTLRTSSGRVPMAEMMVDRSGEWGMTRIPQADSGHPATVLFGPNITIFNTTGEQQRAAWAFVKHFTSKESSVRWALGTGYLPLRHSAADDPSMQAFWKEWKYNRAAFDCLPFARPEPNITGWQQVRDLVHHAETAVLSQTKTGREAALELKQRADAALARQ